jgi:hypothetical protein
MLRQKANRQLRTRIFLILRAKRRHDAAYCLALIFEQGGYFEGGRQGE